jgi:hypothetical protein
MHYIKLEEKNQFTDRMGRLGDREVFSIQNEVILKKLFSAESTFWKEFGRDEISSINFGSVDEREVIIVTLDMPEGSLLPFYLPSVSEGFPAIIDYGTVQPFHLP